MTTKLNSYTLPDDVVERMKLKIEETRQKNIELGFGLCRMKFVNILKPGYECTGDQCSIIRTPNCPTGLYIGGYHTHPIGITEPSIADLKAAYINDVECIGTPKENIIRCFVRIGHRKHEDEKDIISKFKDIEEPFPKTDTGHAYAKSYKIWKTARDDILAKHFQIVDIK